MNGQTKSFKQYNEYLNNMPEPIMPSQLPKRKINFSGISRYAKEHNICVAALSEEEKNKLIELIGKF